MAKRTPDLKGRDNAMQSVDLWGERRFVCVVMVALVAIVGCASNTRVIEHAFSFDMRGDGQDAEVLDYRYGESSVPIVSNSDSLRAQGISPQSANVMGPIQRGDFLYVKWREKSTGSIYEDTVDLRQRLPADIKDHRIHFMIRGPQLYVFLISPQRRPTGTKPTGPEVYSRYSTVLIYPDRGKP